MQVYWLDCSPLSEPTALERVLPCLDAPRREKTLRLQTAERRAQSAAAGLLLRHLFGDAEYGNGPHGKPYLKDESRCFSLSHTDRYVVLAVADDEVGVDVEAADTIRPAVKRRCFTDEEQEWIGEDTARFFRLWTMKEAYMKLTGTGLSVAAKDIALTMPPSDGYDSIHDCYWWLLDTPIPCSVCTKKNDSVEIVCVEIKDLL